MSMSPQVRAGSDFLGDLGRAARDNPVPAALIGMGVLWMLSGGKRVPVGRVAEGAVASLEAGRSAVRSGAAAASEAASDGVSKAGSRIGETVQSMGETVQNVGAKLGESVAAAGDNVKATGSAAVDQMAQTAQSLPGRVQNMRVSPGAASDFLANIRAGASEALERQPLLLGAVGIAIGAGIAASLPLFAREAELLRPATEGLKDRTEDFALDQAKRAGELASNVASAATEEARAQGLTMEGAKAAAAELGGKLKNIAEAAKTNGRQATH